MKFGLRLLLFCMAVARLFDPVSALAQAIVSDRLPIEIVPIVSHASSIDSVSLSRDASLLLSSAADGMKLWDTASGRLIRTFPASGSKKTIGSLLPDGKRILRARTEGSLDLLDAATGRVLRPFTGQATITAIAISPDARLIAATGYDGNISIWDADTGQLLRTLSPTSKGPFPAFSLVFSQDSTRLLSSGSQTFLWDVASGKIQQRFSEGLDGSGAVAIAPDGATVATSSGDARSSVLKFWDVPSGRMLRSVNLHSGGVNAISYSPDGRQLLAANTGKTLTLVDAESGTIVRSFQGHVNAVNSAALSADGLRAFSGSSDHSIKMWNVSDAQLLKSFSGASDSVNAVAFSPDGTRILSGGGPTADTNNNDNTVKLWDAINGGLLSTLVPNARRPLPRRSGRLHFRETACVPFLRIGDRRFRFGISPAESRPSS